MPKLFSNSNKRFLSQVDKSERELNKFICDSWNSLFPKYTFITSEFPLKGNVRSLGTNGRIDILGYNPETKKLVIFELKKDYDKNITDQTADYRDYVQDNFSDVYLNATQKYNVQLPIFTEINRNTIEIILIAKKFSLTQIKRVEKKENNVTLIEYYWFENDLIFFNYINNAPPDDIKIENVNTKQINEIKDITSQLSEQFKIDQFFSTSVVGKDIFLLFLKFLKEKGDVRLDFKQKNIRIRMNSTTFSVIKRMGGGSRRAILLIYTNIDVTSLKQTVLIDDRYRGEGVRMRGGWGAGRYEVYIRNGEDLQVFCDFIKDIN